MELNLLGLILIGLAIVVISAVLSGKKETFSCEGPVHWEPDSNMFDQTPITTNPYAKSDGSSCRTDSQCASGVCTNHCI